MVQNYSTVEQIFTKQVNKIEVEHPLDFVLLWDFANATGALEDEMSKIGNCISINGTSFTVPRT
ncbi:hypothetical protein P5673_016702 [Acropora cervicornis]|uniref:Uncharacterized protein n=1 Tax=Acropora cervicornis TaxID=6130 RepID=A0AAD9QFG2_ACRCE|nr:hypothetical protein P5673_016702 [Acropora cervicornis]